MAMNYQYGGKDIALLGFLEERLKKDPGSAFFAMLAYFYLGMDKIPEALSIAQRGVIVHPNYSTGHTVLAMAMMRAGFYRDAKKELLKAADLRPGSKMIEQLSEEVERQEQADSIGRRIAEQYRKGAGADIMKTVEEALKSNPIKTSDEDLLIPGLESIIGEEFEEPPPKILTPRLPDESSREETGYETEEGKPPDFDEDPGTAREIIDRVTREFGDKISTDLDEPAAEEAAAGGDEISEDAGEFDLDTLARELDSAAPIRPDNETSGVRDESEGIELTPEIVTDTIAAIFEQQGQIGAALEAYNILIKKKPEQAEFYRKKIAELESRSNEEH